MSGWHRVSTTHDVPDGEVRLFTVATKEISVAHVAGEFFAFDDTCSHAEVSLADGMLEGYEIECCAHGARFDVRSGTVTCPPATEPIATYPIKREGDDIYVNLSGQ
jgi:3-phenylpropionate/trans-cinnamate dioxygenase ferredoxin component